MNWTPATIVSKKIWSEGLFTLQMAAPQITPFTPGQFLHLAMREGDEQINRPYSVASPHGEIIEFFIVRVEDGKLTPKLWGLDAGDEIEVSEKAAGSFTLAKTPDATNLWMIATGTGLAPYIAMLRTEEPWERYQKIVVVHGVRHNSDFAYQEEFQQHQQKYGDRFSYVPVLSREDVPGTLRGRIPQVMESGSLEEAGACPISKSESAILLCGNPAMLDEMEKRLGQREMTKHRKKAPGQIVLERYW
ncbi:MAG: ferredoxin--NADP reductase [Planctomycetota bacterium]|nr:ferredoxin--NADP reductase [Planctomycetota bacterium]